MKCSKCQHQLPKNSQVCNRCGAIQATTSAYWKEGKGSNRTLPALLLIGFGLLLLLSLAVGQLLTSGTLSNSVSEEEEETAGFLGFECRSEAIGEHVRDLHAEDLDSAAILIRIRAQEIDDLELLICEDEEGSPVFTSWELEDYEAYVEVLMEVACQPVSAGDSANRIGSPARCEIVSKRGHWLPVELSMIPRTALPGRYYHSSLMTKISVMSLTRFPKKYWHAFNQAKAKSGDSQFPVGINRQNGRVTIALLDYLPAAAAVEDGNYPLNLN